jgi:GntR family transcriptional regulator
MSAVLRIDATDPMPIYAQLERSVRFAIATGELRIGDQLPTVRQLAVNLRINANTVAKVYAELERTGVLETRRGVGTFVRAREFEAVRRSVQQRELRSLVDKFVAEAASLGFSADDIIDQLKSSRRKEAR